MLDESMLIAAFGQYHRKLNNSLPNEEQLSKINFSIYFERRMERLIRRQKTIY